ncbi:daptide biosynthesis RiPP recognition protein [Streptomyces sp. W16]|uniref:daptide biosynthesis RiPP recognition protein n=1 Tax=Streptomyces sp. W16 TaxID=3076631 RepID=UPI00295A5D6C|nr:daptide biosynthesis RiPP recognition protein [Streptomyces sp. W16]MDV9172914.1 daptide biosynthesis RiPP recognition protein [Streptomyces sp. W16]
MSALKERLMSWATGRTTVSVDTAHATRTVVLEDAEYLATLLASDVVDTDTMVFAPGAEGSADSPGVIGYEGSLAEPGTEFTHDPGFYLQIQAYGISEYMSVVGPTLVRVADTTDFESYLLDADRAHDQGTFADFLTNPAIQLADLPALGAGQDGDGPGLRLYVGRSGEISTSPGGNPLGKAGDSFGALAEAWTRTNAESGRPCGVCLGAVVPEADRVAALAQRPWLGRYLAAVHALRDLRARGVLGTGVSGFGERLMADLAEHPEPADVSDADLPLLLRAGEDVYAHDSRHGRTFRLSRAVAETAEALLVCGSVDAASRYVEPAKADAVLRQFTATGLALVARPLVDAGRRGAS